MKEARNEKKQDVRKRTKQKQIVNDCRAALAETNKKLEWLRGLKEHAAITLRNRHVNDRIQNDFRLRQKRVTRNDSSDLYDGTVEVFPVSADAYWGLKAEGEKHCGFPDALYTGIPRLRQWLIEVTFPAREKHLDATLNSTSRLFYGIQKWANTEKNVGPKSVTSTPQISEGFLREVHGRYLKNLSALFDNAAKKIKKLDPLKNNIIALESCNDRCLGVIRRWSFKYPENNASSERIHWATYNCNLCVSGGRYQSRGRSPHTYNWIESL